MPRECDVCGRPITKSDGAVLAGDFNKLLAGEIDVSKVRETCGLCMLLKAKEAGLL